MNLDVSEDLRRAIQRHLDRGQFSSPEEVLQAALNHLDDYQETVRGIRQSFEDENAGRVHSLGDVDASLRKKYGFTREP